VEHKQRLLDMADALLARETLDAEQVKRLSAGLSLDEPTLAPAPNSAAPADARGRAKERPAAASIVPPIPPRPLTQE
jgi:hypothetical protein